jgi:5-methyltetrahydropteroyltriglutamate--homocysteine methyltransferase
MPLLPLTSQIVGSYAKPHWLNRHQRMRALDGSAWRPEPEVLQEAKRDAARLAIYEQERVGLDLVTDGEAQRATYDRDFLAALSGIDLSHTDVVVPPQTSGPHRRDYHGWEEYAEIGRATPLVTGPVRFQRSLARDEAVFAKSVASKPLKTTVIGPLSLSRQVADHHYGDREALILDLAAALNQEMLALQAVGVDLLQIDEPAWHFDLDLARRIGHQAMSRMVEGISIPVIAQVCYGYATIYKEKSASREYPETLELLANCPIAGISLEYEQPGHEPAILKHCGAKHVVLGLLDLGNPEVETPRHIADRLLAALEVVPAERLHPSSDCGMWHLPRERAYAKIEALAEATRIVKQRLGLAVAALS